MKIGIATITDTRNNNFNYGNILQNFALTTHLKKLGHEVNTIYYETKTPDFSISDCRPGKSLLQIADDSIRIIKRTIFKPALIEKKDHRIEGFKEFINDHIVYSKKTYRFDSDFSQLSKLYDCFITGSDQVWNPYWEGSNEFFYLPFAGRNQRITYAPSLGIGYIPDEIKQDIGRWLNNFDVITIREEEGKNVLEGLYGKKSTVVCDPVFLLSGNEWLNMCGDVEDDQYFAVYILGKKIVETKTVINKLSKRTGFKPIDLYYKDDLKSKFCSPIEFLSYLNKSKFILTDSFHAAAFSIIFNKPVVIIDRNAENKNSEYKMSGRIDNLLNLVNLKDRDANSILSGKSELMDYPQILNSKLETLIADSKKILQEELDNVYE